MSCIHYKFRASLEYKTLTFDGLHISVADLKREICEKENIKAESFDLVLNNAQTKRVYQAEGNELIPRNSSVIVQRVPRENAMKLPKVQDRSTEGIVNRKGADPMSSSSGLGEMADFTGMTEEERLTRIKEQSTMKYHPSNYQKRVSSIMTGQPPPTYTCNRCHQPGHWFKNCPQLNARRTTGIPSEELMITTADDPQAYLHPSGKYVVPIMHRMAREMGKKEKRPFSEEETASASPSDNTSTKAAVPNELKCPLCDDLLRDAVLAVCCGDSFCDECIRSRLIESEAKQCPGLRCHQTGVSPDSLVPNIRMRQAVENFRNEAGYTYHNAASRRPMQPSSSSSSSMFMSSSSSMSSSMSAAPATTSAMADAVGQTQQTAPIVVERVRIGLPPLGSMQQKAPTTGLPPVLSNLMSQTGVTKPQSPAYQETVDQAATFRQPQPPVAFHQQQTLSALESEAAAQASSTPPHHSMSGESTTTTNATASSDMTGIIGMAPVEGAPLPAFLLAPPPAIGLPFGHSSNSDGVARPPLATVAPLPAALPVATVPPQVAVSHASYQSAGMASFSAGQSSMPGPPGVAVSSSSQQPPPPGLSVGAPFQQSFVHPPPPVAGASAPGTAARDAWDDFIDRKDRKRRKRQQSSSSSSSSESSDSRSRSRSRSRSPGRGRRHRRGESRSRSRSRSPRHRRRTPSPDWMSATAAAIAGNHRYQRPRSPDWLHRQQPVATVAAFHPQMTAPPPGFYSTNPYAPRPALAYPPPVGGAFTAYGHYGPPPTLGTAPPSAYYPAPGGFFVHGVPPPTRPYGGSTTATYSVNLAGKYRARSPPNHSPTFISEDQVRGRGSSRDRRDRDHAKDGSHRDSRHRSLKTRTSSRSPSPPSPKKRRSSGSNRKGRDERDPQSRSSARRGKDDDGDRGRDRSKDDKAKSRDKPKDQPSGEQKSTDKQHKAKNKSEKRKQRKPTTDGSKSEQKEGDQPLSNTVGGVDSTQTTVESVDHSRKEGVEQRTSKKTAPVAVVEPAVSAPRRPPSRQVSPPFVAPDETEEIDCAPIKPKSEDRIQTMLRAEESTKSNKTVIEPPSTKSSTNEHDRKSSGSSPSRKMQRSNKDGEAKKKAKDADKKVHDVVEVSKLGSKDRDAKAADQHHSSKSEFTKTRSDSDDEVSATRKEKKDKKKKKKRRHSDDERDSIDGEHKKKHKKKHKKDRKERKAKSRSRERSPGGAADRKSKDEKSTKVQQRKENDGSVVQKSTEIVDGHPAETKGKTGERKNRISPPSDTKAKPSVENMFDQANSDFGAKKITMVLPSSSNRQVKLKKATKQWDDSDSDVPDGHLSITTEATEKTLVVVADRQKRLVSVDDATKADKRVVNVNPSRSADLCVTVGKEAMGDDGSSRKRKDEPKKTKSTRHSSTADSDDDSSYPARRR